MSKFKFEVGKKYKTVHSTVFKVIAVTNGWVIYTLDNSDTEYTWNLLREPVKDVVIYEEPKRGTVWVNVYDNNKYNDCRGSAFETKKAADLSDQLKIRIACVEVPWVEGQGI